MSDEDRSEKASVGGVDHNAVDRSMPPQLPWNLQLDANRYAPHAAPPPSNVVSDVDFWKDLKKLTYGDGSNKAYGAPRVFDLFTLLAITLFFAVLFALLGLLAPALDASATDLTFVISGFVTIVGISQMWLFGSNNPRLASLVSGPVAFNLISWIQMTIAGRVGFEGLFFTLCVSIFLGPLFGYLGGAVVAGVFLVADKFRLQFMKPTSDESRDASFDEVQ
jgi:hypothetical protein